MDEGAAIDDYRLFRRLLFRLIPEVNLCLCVTLGSESLATTCQSLPLAHEASQAFLSVHKCVRSGSPGEEEVFRGSQCPSDGSLASSLIERSLSGHVLSPYPFDLPHDKREDRRRKISSSVGGVIR